MHGGTCVCEGLEVPNDLLGDENILRNCKCREKLSRSSASWKWVVRGAGWGHVLVHKRVLAGGSGLLTAGTPAASRSFLTQFWLS